MSNLLNKLVIVQIVKQYKGSEVLKSLITALLFFVLLLNIFLFPVIQIIYLYVPFMQFFLIGIYIYVSLISIYFNKIFVDTLQTYQVIDTIKYEVFKRRSTTVMTIITFIIVFAIYLFLH